MPKRSHTPAMRMVIGEHRSCELCGSTRQLQAHHIIPIVFGGPDIPENILCVCQKCHSLLTPHSILTKKGLQPNRLQVDFYQHFNDLLEAGESVGVIEIMDYLDEKIFPALQ